MATTERDDLKQDFEAYLKGERPSPLALLRAPHIEEWGAFISSGKGQMRIGGIVTKHPSLDDGQIMGAVAVVWIDRNLRWFRSNQRIYTLGRPAGTEIPIDGVDL
jgi:hypothetical protein